MSISMEFYSYWLDSCVEACKNIKGIDNTSGQRKIEVIEVLKGGWSFINQDRDEKDTLSNKYHPPNYWDRKTWERTKKFVHLFL